MLSIFILPLDEEMLLSQLDGLDMDYLAQESLPAEAGQPRTIVVHCMVKVNVSVSVASFLFFSFFL